jgi:hypothetical protein
MSANIFFAPIRTPFVDPTTGIINRQWYLFLQALFNRTGGTIAPGVEDVLQSVDMGLDASTVFGVQQADMQGINQLPPGATAIFPDDLSAQVAELRELVAQLMTTVQAIQQGAIIQ